MNTTALMLRFQSLPVAAQKEIADFIDFLLAKYSKPAKKIKQQSGFSFNWEGSLSEYKKKYTSVELQHKASQWRNS